MASPIGGLLEGYTLAQQLKRQRDQDIADEAIRQADLMFKRESLDLDRQRFAANQENTKADNDRLAAALQALNAYRDNSLDIRQQNTDLRAQGQQNAMLRFAQDQNLKRKQFVSKVTEGYRKSGHNPHDAMGMAYADVDRLDKIVGTFESTLPTSPPSLSSGSALQNFGQVPPNAQGMATPPSPMMTPAPAMRSAPPVMTPEERAAIEAKRQEASPEFQMKQSVANAGNALKSAQAATTKERLRQLTDLYPLVKAGKGVSNDLARLNVKLRTEQIQTQKLINQFTPEQMQGRIDQAAATIGKTQADTIKQLEQVKILRENAARARQSGGYVTPSGTIKLRPDDPRASKGTLNETRRLIETVNNSYRSTLKELSDQRLFRANLMAKIAEVEQGRYPAGIEAPEDKDEAAAFQQQYLLKLHTQAAKIKTHIDQLTPLAENQRKTLDDLERERLKAAKEQNKAVNALPEISGANLRKLSNGITMPANPTAPQKRGYTYTAEDRARKARGDAAFGKKTISKPASKMTDAELDAAIERARRKKR